MKPSFIERLSNSKKLNQYDLLFNFKNEDNESKRKIIINRLQDLEWQLLYLCYFINLITEKVDFSNDAFHEKLNFDVQFKKIYSDLINLEKNKINFNQS